MRILQLFIFSTVVLVILDFLNFHMYFRFSLSVSGHCGDGSWDFPKDPIDYRAGLLRTLSSQL